MRMRAVPALLSLGLLGAAGARAEEMTQRLGIQPMFGYVAVTGDSLMMPDCHDSFFSGGQSAGVRLNMGITRWFSIAFTLQPAVWSVRRGHFLDTRSDPAYPNECGELGADPQGVPITGYERFVITS